MILVNDTVPPVWNSSPVSSVFQVSDSALPVHCTVRKELKITLISVTVLFINRRNHKKIIL